MKRAAALVLLLLAAACHRTPASAAPPDAAPTASAAPPDASPEPAPPDPAPTAAPDEDLAYGLPPAPVEPQRVSLRSLAEDRALAPHEAMLRAHFDGALPSPIEIQVTALAGRRRATLVTGEARRRHPILLVTSATGELLWTKERPLAGTRQVVTEMLPTAGPRGDVALMWCDIPTQVVGLRMWGADGTVLADFQVLEVDVCEALSGLYWPGHGWIAVASEQGGARAQLLDEVGKRTWGPRGVDLPWGARPTSPVSIAVDGDDSMILLQLGAWPGSTLQEHVIAMRYDARGKALWEFALDLGPPVVGAKGAASRIQATPAGPGKVKVDLGARGSVIVTSAGEIVGAR